MKKTINEFLNEHGTINDDNIKIAYDENIIEELKKLYKGTNFDKIGIVEDRINNLLSLHTKWLDKARIHYGAKKIAEILFKYETNLNKY
jgi:hypothetical protein